MKQPQTVRFELTKEQLKILKPLYKKAEKKPFTGTLIGQAKDDGIMVVAFLTPEELQQKLYKMVMERENS